MTDVDPGRSALLVVDMQPDFMPGGALAVDGGDELVGPIAELMSGARFAHVVATQDWHPAGHVSFGFFTKLWPRARLTGCGTYSRWSGRTHRLCKQVSPTWQVGSWLWHWWSVTMPSGRSRPSSTSDR